MRPIGVVTSGARVSLAPALIFKDAERVASEEALVLIDDIVADKRFLGVLRWLNRQDPLLKHTQRSAVVDNPGLAYAGADIPYEYGYVRIIGELANNGEVSPPKAPPTPRSVIKLIESPTDVRLALDTENGLVIGEHKHSGICVPMPQWVLPYHVGVVGATGSGKSRLVKALIDEVLAKTRYSVIVFDHSGTDYAGYWPEKVVRASEIALDPLIATSLIIDRTHIGKNGFDYVLTAIYAYLAAWGALSSGGQGRERRKQSRPLDAFFQAPPRGREEEREKGFECPDNVFDILEKASIEDPEALMRDAPWDLRTFIDCLTTVAEELRAKAPFIAKMRLLLRTYGRPIIEGFGRRSVTSKEVIEMARAERLVVVDLSGEEQAVKRHIVASIIERVWRNIEETRERQDLIIVVDEAHNYACQSGCYPSSQAIERVAREGRKWGLGLVLASQRMIDVGTDIRGNINTYFFSRLQTPGDFDALAGVIDLGGLSESSLSLLDKREFFFAGLGNPLKYPLLMKVRKVDEPGKK